MELHAFRSLVDSASDVIYQVDRAGRVSYVNPAIESVLGYHPDELLGRRVLKLIAPGSAARIAARYRRQIRDREETSYVEVPVVAADGRIVWFGQQVHVVSEDGRFVSLEAIARDISEHRRLAELQLGQKSLLELVARGKPLLDTLDTIACFLEAQLSNCAVALVVLDHDGRLLRPLVAPGLSKEEKSRIETMWSDRFPIPDALDVPARERVVISDLRSSEDWEGFQFAACWTVPVLSKGQGANGGLAFFHHELLEPEEDHHRLIDMAAQIAGIAIERDRMERGARMELKRQVAERTLELEQSNRMLRHEIEERLEAERALRTSESLLKEAERIAHLGSWSWTPGASRQLWSDETYRIFGVSKKEFAPSLRSIIRRIHPDDRRRIRNHFASSTSGEVWTGEFRIVRPNGEERVVELEFSHRSDSGQDRVIGVLHDITEQRLLEKEILKAGERERKRVGRDLHDGLGQLLTGIGFLSKTLAQTLEAGGSDAATEAAEITDLVENAIDHTRSLSKLLLPVELEENGLEAALQRLRSHVEGVYGISCRLKTAEYRPIQDSEIALHIYRVAQEAVNNAVRHGKPTMIDVSLTTRGGRTVLSVADDGFGIPENVDQLNTGLGLRTMQYRAQTIGAALVVARRKPRGTRVVCELPTALEEEPHELLESS